MGPAVVPDGDVLLIQFDYEEAVVPVGQIHRVEDQADLLYFGVFVPRPLKQGQDLLRQGLLIAHAVIPFDHYQMLHETIPPEFFSVCCSADSQARAFS